MMKSIAAMTMLCATASCGTVAGNFCDLARPMLTDDADLAGTIVQRDRALAREMNRHNLLVEGCAR